MEEEKTKNTLENVFLHNDCSYKISLLEKLLNEETFYWSYVPKGILILFSDSDFAKLVLDGKTPKPLFLEYSIDKKVFMFCHLYHWICGDVTANELMNVVKIFYKIEYRYSNGVLDKINNLPIVKYITNKTDANIINALENEPSLQTVMKYYDQNDIKKAIGELRKVYEEDEFQNFVKQSNNEIKFIYHFVYKIISIIDVHPFGKGKSEERIKSEFEKYTKELQNLLSRVNGSNNVTDIKTLNDLQVNCGYMFNNMIDQKNLQLQYKDFNETEARVWFDLGLSIYRLFTIYGDL